MRLTCKIKFRFIVSWSILLQISFPSTSFDSSSLIQTIWIFIYCLFKFVKRLLNIYLWQNFRIVHPWNFLSLFTFGILFLVMGILFWLIFIIKRFFRFYIIIYWWACSRNIYCSGLGCLNTEIIFIFNLRVFIAFFVFWLLYPEFKLLFKLWSPTNNFTQLFYLIFRYLLFHSVNDNVNHIDQSH